MHFPDVSHDVSHSCEIHLQPRHAEQTCGCARTTCPFWWITSLKPSFSSDRDPRQRAEKPGISAFFHHGDTRPSGDQAVGRFVSTTCKHFLLSPSGAREGSGHVDTLAHPRRAVGAGNLPKHRLPSHRSRALRACVCGISDPHRRRIRPAIHHTPAHLACNIRTGR